MPRKPKPTALKLLDGSAKKNPQRLNKEEPEAFDEPPRRPKSIKHGTPAFSTWNWCIKQLSYMQVLASTDLKVLENYCMTYQKWLEAHKVLDKEGSVLTKVLKDGSVQKTLHPMERVRSATLNEQIKLMGVLGLTPADRPRLHKLRPQEHEEKTSCKPRKRA